MCYLEAIDVQTLKRSPAFSDDGPDNTEILIRQERQFRNQCWKYKADGDKIAHSTSPTVDRIIARP
jgi:hypothetical protein